SPTQVTKMLQDNKLREHIKDWSRTIPMNGESLPPLLLTGNDVKIGENVKVQAIRTVTGVTIRVIKDPSGKEDKIVATEKTTAILIDSVRKHYTENNGQLRPVLGNNREPFKICEAFINLAIVKKDPSAKPSENEESNEQKKQKNQGKSRGITDRRTLNTY